MGLKDAPRFTAISMMGNQHAMVLPPSSRVAAYVRAGGAPGEYPQDIAEKLVQSLSAGLSKCRAGYGDTVVLLRGHQENVTASTLTGLVSGTQIIGEGPLITGASSPVPTLTWTADASISFNQPGVRVSGLYFDLASSVDEAGTADYAIKISAPTLLEGNAFLFSAASNNVANMMSLETGYDGSIIRGNVFSGPGTVAAGADLIDITNTGTSVQITHNRFIGSAHATEGFIDVASASTGVYIADNDMYNTTAASTCCIAVANLASDGIICRNMLGVLNDATPASGQGIVFTGTTSTIKCFENYSADQPRLSGILAPAAAT